MLCSLQAAEEGPGWLGLGLFSASRCRVAVTQTSSSLLAVDLSL